MRGILINLLFVQTMLQHILNEKHGLKIAVIMNEFGDSADIEKTAVNFASSSLDGDEERPYEQMLELPNGCLCCSVKDDGVRAIENLIRMLNSLSLTFCFPTIIQVNLTLFCVF